MTTTATVQDTQVDETRIAHQKACSYLKGFVVGYAVRQGMKWKGDAEKQYPEFHDGYKASQSFISAETVTFTHIIYNRLRHERPHIKGGDSDFVQKFRRGYPSSASQVLNSIAERGIDVQEVL